MTQGDDYIDAKSRENQLKARREGLLVGYYHIADGKDYKKEVEHFIDEVQEDIKEGELIVLDWEIEHEHTVDWCYNWLVEVEKKLGFKPLIYLNENAVNHFDWSKVIKNGNKLWIAKYGSNDGTIGDTPNTGDWGEYAIWQYTSRGKVKGIIGNVDLNITNDIEKLRKLGKPKDECSHCCKVHCND
jgi:GH25 family lysozyme M1 (1,4-beta-N-acetylmuramidase)